MDLALLKVQAVVQEAMAEAFRHKVVLQIRNNMQVAAALNPVVAQEVVQEAEQSELQGLLLQVAVAAVDLATAPVSLPA